jgi:hypothetical protein
MSKPQIKVVNTETGEEITRDATAKEITQIELDAANYLAKEAAEETRLTAKAALLDRLGITAEEAQLLLS